MRARRELFALAVLPFLLAGIVWLPAWAFLALLAAVVAAVGNELLAMAACAARPCGRLLPLVLAVAVPAAAGWAGTVGLAVAVTSVVLLVPAAQLAWRGPLEGRLDGAAVAVFAALYVGVTGACLGWIRLLPAGAAGVRYLLLYLFLIWAGDSGAYYVGKNLGRHRMSPVISPKKTWEGLAGGVATTFLVAFATRSILGLELATAHLLGLAGLVAVFAPVGDLVESLFKRATGVKDSATILPGHGGFFDRMDSVLYAAPPFLAYLLVAGLAP